MVLVATALADRAGKAKQVQQLTHRIHTSARHQEGDEAPEDAAALLEEARSLALEIGKLACQINLTNACTTVTPAGMGEMTVTEAIARGDALAAEWKLLTEAAEAASGSSRGMAGYVMRTTRTELRMIPGLPVATLRQEADRVAQERRVLDEALQASNWNTNLLE